MPSWAESEVLTRAADGRRASHCRNEEIQARCCRAQGVMDLSRWQRRTGKVAEKAKVQVPIAHARFGFGVPGRRARSRMAHLHAATAGDMDGLVYRTGLASSKHGCRPMRICSVLMMIRFAAQHTLPDFSVVIEDWRRITAHWTAKLPLPILCFEPVAKYSRRSRVGPDCSD